MAAAKQKSPLVAGGFSFCSCHARIETKFRKIWGNLLSTPELATGRRGCPRSKSNRHAGYRTALRVRGRLTTIAQHRVGLSSEERPTTPQDPRVGDCRCAH